MTGRGIDQVLPHPSDPRLYESYMKSATGYVELAERKNGPIPRSADFAYVWGDALEEFAEVQPAVRIINLETSVTTSGVPWPKGINYRMHPANTPCLTAAGIDCCVLANNHVLDWGEAGLLETVETLHRAGIRTTGAGRNLEEAVAPARLQGADGVRVLVFAAGMENSGVPPEWAAGPDKPGVALLTDLSQKQVDRIAAQVSAVKRPGDIAVFSVHWGGNWGYPIPGEHRAFAHRLIDRAGIDVVHGHSSHHPKAIEVYKNRPVFYGCGDFLNDYEGIGGREEFRSHLVLMYFPSFDVPSGQLVAMEMKALEIRRFRLRRALAQDARWLADVLERESRPLGARVALESENRLKLQWRS
jgi:poly-gamma-glutamate synthesis protein (capsule biosynthesis protein)